MLNLIKKKYFVLTAVLLVGVVLLSGCMGGGDDLLGDDDVDEVKVTESEKIIQDTFAALENQDSETFNSLVSNETTYFFKEEVMNDKAPETLSSEDIYFDLMSYYKNQNLSDINLDNLNIENKSADGIVELKTDNYTESLTMDIELDTSGDELIITKFGFIDKTQINDERDTISTALTALNNNSKNDFDASLDSDTEFYKNGNDDSNLIASNPEDLYNKIRNELESTELTHDYYNIIFESSNSHHKIMLNIEGSTNYRVEIYFGYDSDDESAPVEKVIYYTDEYVE
ncbi:MAG: hypothetical protein ACOCW0_03590 [Halanaerobium sp.]